MSQEIVAFIHSHKLPDREKWQAAIDACKLPLDLDPELDLATHTGFLPCDMSDHEAGFELYNEEVSELSGIPQRLDIADRDRAIIFMWSSDVAEHAAVLGAALALSSCCDAIIYWSDEDQIMSSSELNSELTQVLQELA